jgi:UDP-N-acetylmuramate--alanine ligase
MDNNKIKFQLPTLNKLRNSSYHLIGIGGSGMSSLAELAFGIGCSITGSDSSSVNTKRLKEIGILCSDFHSYENISHKPDYVVISSAIPVNNPEVVKAKEIGIPIIHRSDFLNDLMKIHQTKIVVCGAHGKTSTTGLIFQLLNNLPNFKPSVYLGGVFSEDSNNQSNFGGKYGDGQCIVVESDESDRSFLKLEPDYLLLTNISNEHLESYKTIEGVEESFYELASKVPSYGKIVICIDDFRLQRLVKKIPASKIITYGFDSSADFSASHIKDSGDGGSIFKLNYKDIYSGSIRIPLIGSHMVQNMVGSIAIATLYGLNFDSVENSIIGYKGVDRRFQRLISSSDCPTVISDYAHHPREVAATLSSIPINFADRNGKVIVVFQPHRYSRIASTDTEFVDVFSNADKVLLMDIYDAGESPLPGINSDYLKEIIRHRDLERVSSDTEVLDMLFAYAKPEDMIFFMGAGSVHQLGLTYVDKLSCSLSTNL